MLSSEFYFSDLTFLNSKTDNPRTVYLQLAKQTVEEKSLIIDILYIFLGLPSSIIKKKANSEKFELSDKYQFDHLTAVTLKNSISDAIKLCNQAKYVQTESKRLYSTSRNPITKTFCETIFNYLQQYKATFTNLLGQINQFSEPNHPKLTLIKLVDIIMSRSRMMGFLIRCLNSCFIEEGKKSQIVRLLDKMWEIQPQLMAYSVEQRDQIVQILKRTLRIFFENIKDWFGMKKIAEVMDFFIISSNNAVMSEYFLHKNEQIQLLKVPKIIENESQAILEIGKTIRFISLFYQGFEQEKLMRYLNIDKEFQLLFIELNSKEVLSFQRVKLQKLNLNERIKNKKKLKTIKQVKQIGDYEDNPYEMFKKVSHLFNVNWVERRQAKIVQHQKQQEKDEEKLGKPNGYLFKIKSILLQTLQNINKKCLQFFRSNSDTLFSSEKNRIQTALQHTLLGIKKFMLLEQGDFMQQFFNSAEQIIDKQKSEISHNRIYSCIDEAIQNSSAKNLPSEVLNNVSFDFLRQGQKRTERLRLWVLFCFYYRQDNPINYIFNANLMDKLKEICNFIIKLKKGQVVLTKIWDQARCSEDKRNRKGDTKIIKKEKILRNSLLSFLNSCLSYLLTKIDILWQQYLTKIGEAPTIFQIVSGSNQMVTQLQGISVMDKLFFNGTMQGLLLVEKFRKLHNFIIDETTIVPMKQVEQLQFELRTVVEILINIPELRQIINYNTFYDRLQ